MLIDFIQEAYNSDIPTKIIKGKNTGIPKDIRNLILEKRKAKRDYMRLRDNESKTNFNKITKLVKRRIKEYRQENNTKKMDKMKLLNDSKSWSL